MEKKLTHQFLTVATLLAACVIPPPVQSVAAPVTKVYEITFGARGDSKTVESVTVENLSSGKSVTLEGKDTLLLKSTIDPSGITLASAPQGGDLKIVGGKAQVSTKVPTFVNIAVYSTDGRCVWQTRQYVGPMSSSVALPMLGRGVYIMKASAPGFSKSVKWMNTGKALVPGVGTTEVEKSADDLSSAPDNRPAYAPSTSSGAKGVPMDYRLGDVLRFTGTSGKMRTITTNSPRSSHPIYFDFFKCEDANGYNYTIVRAGDMLWMAEDLRKVALSDITDANNLSADVLRKLIEDPNVSVVANGKNTVYYSKTAAMKALPEGWKLPTQGEIDYAIKKLNGGNYATAGRLLKAAPSGQVDSTSLCLAANGRYNGSVDDASNCYLMTRSTKGGKMLAVIANGNDDKVKVEQCPDWLLPVRGVRSAPSAYTELMEEFGLTNNKKMAAAADGQTREVGPLGNTYTQYFGGQSIAYDYTGGQYYGACEARSGVIYKKTGDLNWTFHGRRNANFLSDCVDWDKNKLRKMAAMANGNGTQYVLEMQWDRPLRFVTELIDGKYKRTDTPDVFSRGHNDGVYITIAGDSAADYAVLNKASDSNHYGFYIPLDAYLKPLPKNILPYFLWDNDNRTTETRMDYVQRSFQLLTADFNEDGVDDVVIGIDGEVWVYDGAKMLQDLKQGKMDDGRYTEKPLYHKNFNFKPGTDTYKDCSNYYLKKPMTRFAVGDVDGDGISDIVVLQVGTVGEKVNSKGELLVYGSGNVENDAVASTVLGTTDFSGIVFNDIKVGNVSGGRYNDIIMLFRGYGGTSLAKNATVWRAFYNPDVANGHLQLDVKSNYNVGSFRGFDGHIGNTNITLAHFRGQEYPCDVVMGADMWRWNAESGALEFKFQVLPFTDKDIWSIYADNIIAADPEGTGRDFLYYFRNWSSYDKNAERYMLQGFSETYFNNRSGDVSADGLVHNHNYNSDIFKYCETGKVWNSGEQKQDELMWWFGGGDTEWGNSAALCAMHSRPGAKVFKYKGHQSAFSEPRIYALIAAPPTYDYGDEEEPNYDYVTMWGYSKSSSKETTKSSSISASTIVGFECEINAPLTGTKIGGTDFTVKMQNECGKSVSNSQTVSYSENYEARDDNNVVMQVTPYDNYTYEVVASSNVDDIGGELNLSIPQNPMTIGLALKDYDRLIADAKGAPDLHKVFKHEIGNPFSYPSTPDEINCNVPNSNIMWGNGRWNDFATIGSSGSIIREISLDNSTATSASFSFSVETELVLTVGCAKAGYGFGYNGSNETTHSESSGFSVSACVPGLAPGDRNPNRKFFSWNLCWYKYQLDGQTFPVVNYIVKKR